MVAAIVLIQRLGRVLTNIRLTRAHPYIPRSMRGLTGASITPNLGRPATLGACNRLQSGGKNLSTVKNMISRSSHQDRFSTYTRSYAMRSRQGISVRPLT